MLADWNGYFRERAVLISIPKFDIARRLKLDETLKHLGMPKAFSDDAQFGTISRAPLKIGAVISRTRVAVDEGGTSDNGTKVVKAKSELSGGEPVGFKANRSFFFFMRAHESGLILFAGQVVNPPSSELRKFAPSPETPTMTVVRRYFVLAGRGSINSATGARDSQDALRFPTERRFAGRSTEPWSVADGSHLFRRRGDSPRFLLTDIDSENILYHLDLGQWLSRPARFDRVLEVHLPADAETGGYEEGHHDSASNITFYEGLRSDRMALERCYRLDQIDDIEALIARGMFTPRLQGIGSNRAAQDYGEWLIKNGLLDLFLHFEEHFDTCDLASTAAYAGQTRLFHHWLEAGNLPEETLAYCLEIACKEGHEKLVRCLVEGGAPTKKAAAAMASRAARDGGRFLSKRAGIVRLIRDPDLLCEELRVAAACGKLKGLIKKNPELSGALAEIRHRTISMALALDSDPLIEFLDADANAIKEAALEEFDQQEHAPFEKPKIHFESGRFFVCRRLLENNTLDFDQRHACLLAAAGKGYLGLIKLLVDRGVDLEYWSNHTAKCANKYGYKPLRNYLRRKIGRKAATSTFS